MSTPYVSHLLIAFVAGSTACYGAPDDAGEAAQAVTAAGSAQRLPTVARGSGASASRSISSGEQHRMIVSAVGGCGTQTGKQETITQGGCTYTLQNFNCEYVPLPNGERPCVCMRRVISTSGDCTQVSIQAD